MGILDRGIRVLVDFTLEVSDFLWLAEAFVHHELIVLDETHFTLELRVEVVLASRKLITLFLHRCTVAFLFATKSMASLRISSKTVVEGLFAMGRVIHKTEST